MAHYGTEYPFQSKVVQEQMKATNRQRYGVETPRERGIPMDRYGTFWPSQESTPRERGIRSSQSHTWT